MAASDVELIRGIYAAFSVGDVPAVLGAMSPEMVWNEAENFPYADNNPYRGPQEVGGLFGRIVGDWDGFTVEVGEILDAGGKVIMLGHYVGRHRVSGKAIRAQVVHVWSVSGGQATAFQQYADTLQVARAAGIA